MPTTKLEIVKNSKTIVKLIFVQKENTFDVKICIPCNDYYIKGYTLFNSIPIIQEVSKNDNVEIELTYHSKKGDLSPKIHYKIEGNDNVVYQNLPIARLSSPTIDSFVPFPLMKIELPDNTLDIFHNYDEKHKNRYRVFDVDKEHKVVELYLVGNHSKVFERYSPYLELQTYFSSCNFEYFCTNRIDPKKTPFFFKDNNFETIRKTELIPLNDFRLLIVTSIFPSLERMVDKPVFTFVENELSDAIFFHSLIKHRVNGENGLFVGNMRSEKLELINEGNAENYWSKYSLSYILYKGTRDSNERKLIKNNALNYLLLMSKEIAK